MRAKLVSIALVFLFIRCNPFNLKPLDIKTIKENDITVRWFNTSDITTVHNHVELDTDKGWVEVMEADGNAYEIYNVLINKDTIIVQGYKGMLLYDITPKYSGKYIRFDSSITLFKYMSKFDPANAEYCKN